VLADAQAALNSARDEVAKDEAQIAIEVNSPPAASSVLLLFPTAPVLLGSVPSFYLGTY
jgi:hypothetical protein